MVQGTQRHYSAKQMGDDYLKRRLHLEAKTAKGDHGSAINDEQNRLRKNKSVLLFKVEDSFDAMLDLIENSRYSNLLEKEIEKSWSNQSNQNKKDQEDIRYFKEKVYDEFDEITQRIFSEKRIERMLKCIFKTRPYEKYQFDSNQAIYRLTIAKILLSSVNQEFVSLLAPDFQNLISKDLGNTVNVVNNILRIVKHGINPIRGMQ